jgi:predicted XRE-type DNA-binding protein
MARAAGAAARQRAAGGRRHQRRPKEAERIAPRRVIMKKRSNEVGRGNVSANIAIPIAEKHLVKAQLIYRIDGLMKVRRLKQVDAAKLFGVTQPDVSHMLHGYFRQFSVERARR